MIINGTTIEWKGETQKFLETARDKNISAFGMRFGGRVLLAAELAARAGGTLAYICADDLAAKKAYAQFLCVAPDTVLLAAKDDVLSLSRYESVENNASRLAALSAVCQNPRRIVVATVEAACQLFPPRAQFISHTLLLEKNKEYDPLDITRRLVRAGYKREPVAVARGQFSLRGDILDIFPIDRDDGIRVEFFGDTAESIRVYDPFDLKSGAFLDAASVPPNTEVFYSDDGAEALLARALADIKKPQEEKDAENYHALCSRLASDLTAGARDMRLSFLMPLLEHAGFADFLKPAAVVFDDVKPVCDQLNLIYAEHENRYKSGLLHGTALRSAVHALIPLATALSFQCPKTAFHSIDSQNRLFAPEQLFNFISFEFPVYHRNFEGLADDVRAWMSNGYRIVVYCGSDTAKERLAGFFADAGPMDTGGKGLLEFCGQRLAESAVFEDEKLILIGTSALTPAAVKKVVKRAKRDAFTEPAVGAHVVHQYHGIGFCEAVTRLALGGAERDYAVIRYAGGDTLYVPVENMDSLSRYGEGEEVPKLSKIGGAEFARVKQRVKESVSKMALDLSRLYASRSAAKGHRYSANNELYDAFAADFPYAETEDQLTAADECLGDLTAGKVMDRLLCGDVGYGKTEVALRAAFKVIAEGKQVAFLSPTTILARQHFATVKKRMDSFGVMSASLTRFDSVKEISATLQGLAAGRVDIVCGTHRLLSSDVQFKELGLLILDEEQRFGVADKEKIKALKTDVNVLTLSATPIPRTLHLSLSGIRDISVLDTPPADRLPIKTYVTEYTEELLEAAVLREKGRGGQVFIVYNRVATIDRFAAEVKNLLGEKISITVAHGQMTGDALENAVAAFAKGETDVLIASTIIENGIDMPNANTLFVVDSDRFGLSQLYQLRGRVGRSDRLAHAYFTYDGRKALTENAYKRLDAVTQFTEFGSGFKIAMRDLEIRGAGNMLGREQHGHIEKVGYDMYYKILAETIDEINGGAVSRDRPDVKVTTDFNAFIPENYLADKELRVRVYSRISQIASIADRKKLTDELTEIYGPVPAATDNLMLVALLKNLAVKCGADGVSVKKSECYVQFGKVADIPRYIEKFPSARIDPVTVRVGFGADRAGLTRFLLCES